VTTIAEYHRAIKARLIADPLVIRFDIRRERRTVDDGYLRARLTLSNSDQLEFSEYIHRVRGEIQVITYSYHWADSVGDLIRRWDNAPHFPRLPNAPDHIHDRTEHNVIPGVPTSFSEVLDEIAERTR
jgi:hypothetical protein